MRIPVAYLLYGVAGGALLLMAMRFMSAMMRNINITTFTTFITRLLMEGNLERAIKLCRAAQRSAFVAIILPVIVYAQEHDDVGDMRRTFEEGYATLIKRTGKDLFFGGMGIIVGAFAIIVALRVGKVHPLHFAVCGLSALLGTILIRGALKLRAQSLPAFEKIGAALEQAAVARGRRC